MAIIALRATSAGASRASDVIQRGVLRSNISAVQKSRVGQPGVAVSVSAGARAATARLNLVDSRGVSTLWMETSGGWDGGAAIGCRPGPAQWTRAGRVVPFGETYWEWDQLHRDISASHPGSGLGAPGYQSAAAGFPQGVSEFAMGGRSTAGPSTAFGASAPNFAQDDRFVLMGASGSVRRAVAGLPKRGAFRFERGEA